MPNLHNTAKRYEVVLVASASALRRYGLSQLLKSEGALTVEAVTFDNVVFEIERREVDFVVLEIGTEVSDDSSLKLLRESYPHIGLIVVTPVLTRERMQEVIEAGAHAYVGEAEAPTELLTALRCVRAGQSYLPPSMVEDSSMDIASPAPPIRLSARQQQLLPLIARGLSNKEIAQQLDISVSTAKFHVGTILRSLNSSNRTEAASKATMLIHDKKFG